MLDLHTLTTLFQKNPLLVGGAGVGIVTGIVAYLKQIPTTFVPFVKRKLFCSIEVLSQDPVYHRLLDWIDGQDFCKKSNEITAQTMKVESPDSANSQRWLIGYTLSPGSHVFKFNNKHFWFHRDRKEPDKSGNVVETVKITSWVNNLPAIKKLIEESFRYIPDVGHDYIRIYCNDGSYWDEFVRKEPRKLASVILPLGAKDRIMADLEKFLKQKSRYTELGVPYRRNYLLYGPPGNGKSSIIEAIAGSLKMSICSLSLDNEDIDNFRLFTLLARVPRNSIILVEDIDAAFTNRENKENAKGITFSGLLNAIDGVTSRSGQIIIMTTNHIEKLDPALLRPGRVDYKLNVSNANREQARSIFDRFFPDSRYSRAFSKMVGNKEINMATLQNHLHTSQSDEEALKGVQELLCEQKLPPSG